MDPTEQIQRAIDILDGNAPRIDWTDKQHPELLRKLCEHLQAYDALNDTLFD